MGLLWIPIEKNWRLNERHYGALQVMGVSGLGFRVWGLGFGVAG